MKIEIYAKSWCPYCQRALALLEDLDLDHVLHDVTSNTLLEQEMIERAQRTSVPQIFFGDHHIGGSDELFDAYGDGSLDTLLQRSAA